MGYSTEATVTISTENKEVLLPPLISLIPLLRSLDLDHYREVEPENVTGPHILSYEPAKWVSYSLVADFVSFSKSFPHLLVEIEGWGEEMGDHWKVYICGGKTQEAKMTWSKPKAWSKIKPG